MRVYKPTERLCSVVEFSVDEGSVSYLCYGDCQRSIRTYQSGELDPRT